MGHTPPLRVPLIASRIGQARRGSLAGWCGWVYTTAVGLDELFENAAAFPFPEGVPEKPCERGTVPISQEASDEPDQQDNHTPFLPRRNADSPRASRSASREQPGTAAAENLSPPDAPAQTAPHIPTDAGTAKPPSPRDPLPGVGGVYLLTDAEDRIIQLASAGNLRRALQVRLAPPTEGEAQPAGVPTRKRADLRQIVRKIRWRTAHSAFEISYEYWRLARALLPDGYLKQVAFGPAWFAHVDPTAEIPRFVVGKVLRSPPGIDLGPFFTNADATRFVQVLEDGFDLCRYHHILEQAPRGTACAYFDMGKCPAPCDGSIPMTRYREMIADALAFAAGERKPTYERCEAGMREAAARQAYEHAGKLKQRLERLREIEHKSFAQAAPIERFNYLIVQRGGGRTRVRPFFVRGGAIAPGEAVSLKQLETVAGRWIEATRAASGGTGRLSDQAYGPTSWSMPPGAANTGQVRESAGHPLAAPLSFDRQALSEQIWLVSHFLGKKEPPGLFVRADRLPPADELPRMIRERFRKPEPAPPEQC